MKIAREELIKLYLDFFKSKNHVVIPSASLVPENDPTVLFTTAGMQPLVPFLLGQSHPLGKRICNVQGCIRTVDIEEVGDSYHHTFFEMIGNWSLGDYWKKDAIEMTFEFLTKKLNIPVEKLAVTCFKGNTHAKKDTESSKIWEALGIPKKRIAFLKDNWWGPAGEIGPCGPNTEVFYWKPRTKAPEVFDPEDEENWVEIGNDVLMQFNKGVDKKYTELLQKNIDFGGGVERMLAVLNGFEDNYETDVWRPLIKVIEKLSNKKYGNNERETRHMRIIVDHIKAATFILGDGVVPSNTGGGYILRRLIRRAVRYGYAVGIRNIITELALPVFEIYSDYDNLRKNKSLILKELQKEEESFEEALEKGLKVAKKTLGKKIPLTKEKNEKIRNSDKSAEDIIKEILVKKSKKQNYGYKKANLSEKEFDDALITGKDAFLLYQSHGFPKKMILELAIKKRLLYDDVGFKKEIKKHQKLSRTLSSGQFKSGLADNSEQTTRLHTATHLLLAAIREVLKDKKIQQKGSNINSERLRFDFNFDRKLTEEELKQIEGSVNEKVSKKIKVAREEMSPKKAKKEGAVGVFDGKYPDIVSVYTIGSFSKEICTGPHVANTKEIGKFKIIKEGSSSAGVRRIKATVE